MEQLDRRLLLGAAGLAGAAAFARMTRAGPLDPPAGAVSSTGRTSTELWDKIARTDSGIAEPRTPISFATTPGNAGAMFRIAAPGSYYLTSNIPGQVGRIIIEVVSPNVSIDLNGFMLDGMAGSSGGIIQSGGSRLRVHNGEIRIIPNGRALELGSASIAHDLVIEGSDGGITAGDGSIIELCRVIACGRNLAGFMPIDVGPASIVDSCIIINPNADSAGAAIRTSAACIVRDSVVLCNSISLAPTGILTSFASRIERCVVRQSQGIAFTAIQTSSSCTIRDNTLSCPVSGTQTGIRASTGCTIEGNALDNYDTGIDLGTASGCVVVRNAIRNASTVVDAVTPAASVIGPVVGGGNGGTNPHANYSL